MTQRDIAYEIYERAMENVHNEADKARELLEKLQMELYDVDLSEDEWRVLDELVTGTLVRLDRIR